MMPHDLLTMYSSKALEYLISIVFLLLFVPFWRFVNAEPVGVPVCVLEAQKWLGDMVDWFLVPDHVYFHPGHAWVQLGDGALATVGVDDFAQKLVGQVSAVTLPGIGSYIAQGERAWSLTSGGKSIDMLSPVDGTVVSVNERVLTRPDIVHQDPYGDGWLLKVIAARPAADCKQLLSGTLAKRWIEEMSENIQAMMTPDLGRVYQDGGLPIQGIARSLDGERWDDVCRRFFLT